MQRGLELVGVATDKIFDKDVLTQISDQTCWRSFHRDKGWAYWFEYLNPNRVPFVMIQVE